MTKVTTAYKMPNARALEVAMSSLDSITLSKCNSMSEYFNNITIIRVDISDYLVLESRNSDEQTMAAIIHGLPPADDGFV
jgi:hypothetical protein